MQCIRISARLPRLIPLVLVSMLSMAAHLTVWQRVAMAAEDPKPARFVRIELPGAQRVLSLAEVQVLRDGRNLTKNAAATQCATSNNAPAARAIDDNWNGVFNAGSVTHTPVVSDAWWEVDLGTEQVIDQVTIWNRTDCCAERLEGFRLRVLNGARETVWERKGVPAPAPRADFSLWGKPVTQPKPRKVDRAAVGPAVNGAIARAVRFLKETQQRDGSWGPHAQRHGCGQTALSVYALLKAGVGRRDPAIVRGVAYLLANPPGTTYSAGCVLMALGALGDEQHTAFMEGVLEDLLDWQVKEGWAYPDGAVDLSNTQYGALGLRAASMFGLDVPEKAWKRLVEAVLIYQEEPRAVSTVQAAHGRTSSGQAMVAGFGYRPGDKNVTGSMTTAGISTIGICEWALGRLHNKAARPAQRAKAYGLAWLAESFSVTSNPGKGADRLDYYLYGLERVGAVLGKDEIGGHDWYWEGAEALLERQKPHGSWNDHESATCFAILFLSRATRATGAKRELPDHLYLAEEEDADVRWRITGERDLTMFVTGFAKKLLSEFDEPDGVVRGMRVMRVDYRVGAASVATVEGDPDEGWDGERFPARWAIPEPGVYELVCAVTVVDPNGKDGATTDEIVSAPITVHVKDTGAEWMTAYLDDARDNLFRKGIETSASSAEKDKGAGKAVDGRHDTAWVAAKDDKRPTLTIELRRPAKANTILFSHVGRHAREQGAFDRAMRVIVRVNRGKAEYTAELDPSDLEKSVLQLPKTMNVRKLIVEIADRVPGNVHAGLVGFSEVELLLRK
ncbi:MAG: hypothetical protein GY711_03370 [bacterium]|nr:hypothetical protein [bacterium]